MPARTALQLSAVHAPAARRAVRVLVVADEWREAPRLDALLDGSPLAIFTTEARGSLAEALSWLDFETPDLVVFELDLCDSQGLATLVRLRQHSAALPLVVLAPARDRTRAEAVRLAGAQRILIKEELAADPLAQSLVEAIDGQALGAHLGTQAHDLGQLAGTLAMCTECRDRRRQEVAWERCSGAQPAPLKASRAVCSACAVALYRH